MATEALKDLIRRAEALTPDEQLDLIARLTQKAQQAYRRPRRPWREICGLTPYPLVGEDAQAWISPTRREADEHREKQLKRKP